MNKIEDLNYYYNELEVTDFYKLISIIYKTIGLFNKTYPNYRDWFMNTQIPGVVKGNRNVLFMRNPFNANDILGVSCLKKENEETKLCSIFVKENYRHQGIGSKLVFNSLNWLENTKPLFTCPADKLDQFKFLIARYDWRLVEIIKNAYLSNSDEFCFNGQLNSSKLLTLKK